MDRAFALVQAARSQIGVTTGYDHGYHLIAYPGGDLSRNTGVCADVVVRAARDAWGVDLQRCVHEDMQHAFAAYPQRWGLAAPDANIDHRRVPNLETYLARHGARLGSMPGRLQPGDLLTWRTVPFGRPHIALVSEGGRWPMVIQNIGWGVGEHPLLEHWLDRTAGWFRWRPL